jgi:cell division protein ZapC
MNSVMLTPTTQWYWFCEEQQLMLSLGDELCFQTAYGNKHCLNLPAKPLAFSLEDYNCYLSLAASIEESGLALSTAQLTEVVLNAVAALSFHKPVALKSWYFDEQGHCGSYHQLAKLENAYGSADVLILHHDSDVVTVMILSENLAISTQKNLTQFNLVKVARNRLLPFLPASYMLSCSA